MELEKLKCLQHMVLEPSLIHCRQTEVFKRLAINLTLFLKGLQMNYCVIFLGKGERKYSGVHTAV